MTSDAKIGLLLGLIFIFVIAFIINGLPRFQGVKNSSELTTTMVSAPNGTLGIGGNERKAQEGFDWPAPANEQPRTNVKMPIESEQDIRFTMPLPQETPVATDTAIAETAREAESPPSQSVEPAAVTPPQENVQADKPEPAKPASPRIYVVAEGDTLGDIAQKLYGSGEGTNRENVMRIFEANRQLLESPDEIDVGQKLTIPPPAPAPGADKSDGVLSGSMFEKVISIGKKHLLPDRGPAPSAGSAQAPSAPPKSSKGQPAPIRPNAGGGKPARPTSGGQAGEYVVREGDYLWRIAAQQLGDGNRYLEIAKLNADQLKNPDDLTPGMRLKMPAR